MTDSNEDHLHHFQELILQLSSSNNEARNKAEQNFNHCKENFPDLFLTSVVQLACRSQVPAVRDMCLVLLRTLLSYSDECLWMKVSKQKQEVIKNEFLQVLPNVENTLILKKLCDAVSSLACTIIEIEGIWGELLELMVNWSDSQNDLHRRMSMNIFFQLILTSYDKLKDYDNMFKELFTKGLQDNHPEVRLSALNGVTSFILVTFDYQEHFRQFIPNMLEILSISIESNEEQTCRAAIAYLTEIAEALPDFFRNNIEEMIKTHIEIAKNGEIEQSTRFIAIEYLITMSESKPGLIRKQEYMLPELLPLLMVMLTEKSENEDWNLGEEYDVEDIPAEVAAESLDRLALSLKGRQMVPILFQELIPNLLENQEKWQYRYAGLIAISLVAEGCSKNLSDYLDQILEMILPGFSDDSPKVRFAAANALGQLASDFEPNFQNTYHETTIPQLVGIMDDINNPRVQAHACAAVTNFVEGSRKEILAPYLDKILPKIVELLQQNNKLVLEYAITCIAAIAQCVKEDFIPFYEVFMPFFKDVLNQAVTEEYRQIRGKAMEAISLIAVAVGKEVFLQDAELVINGLMDIHQKIDQLDSDDPQILFCQQAFGRICKVIGQDFVPYLDAIIPGLLEQAKVKPTIIVTDAEDDSQFDGDEENWDIIPFQNKHIGIKISVLEEKSSACYMIYNYADQLKAGFYPFVKPVVEEFVNLLKFYYHDGVRVAVCSTIPCLIRCVSDYHIQTDKDNTEVHELFRYVFPYFKEAIPTEISSDCLTSLLESLAKSIDNTGPNCMDEKMMEQIYELLQHVLKKFMERREERAQGANDEDYDEEEDERLSLENEAEAPILAQISEVLGSSLKQHPKDFFKYFKEMMGTFHDFLNPEMLPNDHKVALCVFDDLVEYLKEESVQYYPSFMPAMLMYASDEDPNVRQAAAYGLGITAIYGGDVYKQYLGDALTQLSCIIDHDNAKQLENIYCTENAVSSISRILRYQAENLADQYPVVLQYWLQCLPITIDTEESIHVYNNLLYFFRQDGQLLLGENFSNLPKILSILGTIVPGRVTKLINEEIESGIVELLGTMQNEFPAEVMKGAWEQLDDEHKERLSQLVN